MLKDSSARYYQNQQTNKQTNKGFKKVSWKVSKSF